MPERVGIEVHDWSAAHRPELFQRLIIATGDVASPSIREFISRTIRPLPENRSGSAPWPRSSSGHRGC
jgi:hypothetical protein